MRKLRYLLVGLLLLAVPAKGVFAAGMMLCGPIDPHESTLAASGPALHEHGPDAHDAGASEYAHNGTAGDAFVPHGDVKCTLCAACCVGGACLNSLPLPVPLLERSDPAFPPVSERFQGFLPDRLDRPPQRTLV